jgi:hypothetical protein
MQADELTAPYHSENSAIRRLKPSEGSSLHCIKIVEAVRQCKEPLLQVAFILP